VKSLRRFVGGFEVALTQRCTNGDLLAFRARYVQTGFENYSSRQSASVLAIAIN
jgi:hypothetical protein